MRQRILAMSTSRRNERFLSRFESQYLVGAASPSGHSISSVSSARPAAPLIGAMRTRTRAKRERSEAAVPSRQVIVRQACCGRPSASALTLSRNASRSAAARDRSRAGRTNLLQRDLRLGLESDLLWNMRLLTAVRVLGPGLR